MEAAISYNTLVSSLKQITLQLISHFAPFITTAWLKSPRNLDFSLILKINVKRLKKTAHQYNPNLWIVRNSRAIYTNKIWSEKKAKKYTNYFWNNCQQIRYKICVNNKYTWLNLSGSVIEKKKWTATAQLFSLFHQFKHSNYLEKS